MGRDLQRAVTPPRPIGLVEATLGGSSIESWSSADALAACEPHVDRSGGGNGGLWNGLIEPLLSSTLKGVVWYQGECLGSRIWGQDFFPTSEKQLVISIEIGSCHDVSTRTKHPV